MKYTKNTLQFSVITLAIFLGFAHTNVAHAAPASKTLSVQKSKAVSVQESVKNALAYSPSLQSTQEKHQESLHNIRRAKAGYYPTVEVWGNWGMGIDDSIATRATDKDKDITAMGSIGVHASQMIWDGGATASNVRSQRAYEKSSFLNVLDAASLLGYTAIASHMDVVRRRELLLLSQKNVKEHKIILNLLRSRYKNGLSTLGDFEQGISRLARAEATLSTHQLGLQTALANYTRVTQHQAPKILLPVQKPQSVFLAVNEVRDLTVNHNLAIQSDFAKLRGLLGQRDNIRSSFSPSFNISTGPAYTNGTQVGIQYQYTWSTMLNMNWALYSGGATKARFNAMSASVRSARKSLHSRMDLLDEEIKVIFSRTATAAKLAKSYRLAKESSYKSRQNFFQQFKIGKKDLISVLDAENEYFSAAVSEIISHTDNILGQYRLLALTGTLLTELNIDEESLKTAPKNTQNEGVFSNFFTGTKLDEASIFNQSTILK